MERKIRHYAGQAIEITYDVRGCIHAAECVRGLPQLFEPERRPWIELAGALPNAIAAVIEQCLSGAVHNYRVDVGPAEKPDDPTTILPTRNGPLSVRGLIQLRGADGTVVVEDTRMALCRCGASRNKPFCHNLRVGCTDAEDVAGAEASGERHGA